MRKGNSLQYLADNGKTAKELDDYGDCYDLSKWKIPKFHYVEARSNQNQLIIPRDTDSTLSYYDLEHSSTAPA